MSIDRKEASIEIFQKVMNNLRCRNMISSAARSSFLSVVFVISYCGQEA